jgi:hypothetical protein
MWPAVAKMVGPIIAFVSGTLLEVSRKQPINTYKMTY